MNDALEPDDGEQARCEAGYPAHQQHGENDQRRNSTDISRREAFRPTRRFTHVATYTIRRAVDPEYR